MVRSKATSAHTLMVKEIDYERVEQVRRAHGERFQAEEGFSLTYLPFAARATVEALEEFPHLNSSVGDDALIVHHDVNLGIAVDLDNEGLIVPVVHNAEELNLPGHGPPRSATGRPGPDQAAQPGRHQRGDVLHHQRRAVRHAPHRRHHQPAPGGHPVHRRRGRKPVVVELPDGSESIAIHSVGLLAMTFDHRAVDGAYVARFLARLSRDPRTTATGPASSSP